MKMMKAWDLKTFQPELISVSQSWTTLSSSTKTLDRIRVLPPWKRRTPKRCTSATLRSSIWRVSRYTPLSRTAKANLRGPVGKFKPSYTLRCTSPALCRRYTPSGNTNLRKCAPHSGIRMTYSWTTGTCTKSSISRATLSKIPLTASSRWFLPEIPCARLRWSPKRARARPYAGASLLPRAWSESTWSHHPTLPTTAWPWWLPNSCEGIRLSPSCFQNLDIPFFSRSWPCSLRIRSTFLMTACLYSWSIWSFPTSTRLMHQPWEGQTSEITWSWRRS